MAKTVVALEATFNASGAEGSVKSLKAQLKEAQAEVAAMADKFGDTSAQAAEAAKKAAALKDKIGDAKALTDAFNPDQKFKAFSSALSGVAGGFSAVQGAMGLFGADSKELEKTLLKVQSAMALSQGLSAITESADAFKNLKTVAVDAFKGIKAAIGSTGIGLLVVALGTIYAYWDDIKGAVNGVSAEQEKLNAKVTAQLNAEKEKLKNIGAQDNILKLSGKSEREILGIKIKQIDAVIKATEASIVQAKITKTLQVDAAKRNQEILEGLLNFVSLPITAILRGIDLIGKAVGKNFGLAEKFFSGTAKLLFDPEATAKEGDKVIKEQQESLLQLKNDRAGYQLQIQGIDKAASDKAKSEKEKSDQEDAQKEKARLENIAEQNRITDELILRNRIQSIKDEFQRKQFELAVQQQKEIDDQLELLNKGLITQEEYNQKKALIDANYKQQEQDALDAHNAEIDKKNKDALFALQQGEEEWLRTQADKELKRANDNKLSFEERKAALQEREDDFKRITFTSEDERLAYIKATADARTQIGEEEAKAKEQQLNSISGLMQNFANVVGQQTAAGKAAAIAATTINTYTSAMAAYKGMVQQFPGPVGIALGAVSAGLAVATGIANVKKILSVQVPGKGSGGGGGSVPTASAMPSAPVQPQVATTTINQGQVNQLASATARAFVLESDVSGNQERIQRLNRAARIN